MLSLYIARHAEDEDNASGILNGRRDTSLTRKGKNQAKILAENICRLQIGFDKILTSPLKRCVETAEIIRSIAKDSLPIVRMDGLMERDFGIMTGKRTSDIQRLCSPGIVETKEVIYFLESEGCETFQELLQRAHGVLDDLERNETGNILLMTHGDVGKMIYAAFYEMSWKEALKKFHFNNGDLILLSGSG